ncbi:MAG: acetate--CoA ligase, partial [Bacteroidota bacterium]
MSFPYQLKTPEEYYKAYRKSQQDSEAFWADIASHFTWHKPWHAVVRSDFHTANHSWFEGGKL